MAKKPPFTAGYISKGADARLQPEARELAEQLFFMRGKLKALRKELKDAPIITEYDNGGQQRGTHINPAFKAYKDLLLTYTKTVSALEALIGKNDPENREGALTALRNQFSIQPPRPGSDEEDPEEAAEAVALEKINLEEIIAGNPGTDGEVESYWKAGKM